jgi:predicted nucleic acid-binding protein
MVTVWPCFAGVMHLLGRAGGPRAQEASWEYVALGALVIRASEDLELSRMRVLMARYKDTPMDLADAALVTAEALGASRIFSVDSDFYIYRLADSRALEVLPGPRR